jgi:hypothetical protein
MYQYEQMYLFTTLSCGLVFFTRPVVSRARTNRRVRATFVIRVSLCIPRTRIKQLA